MNSNERDAIRTSYLLEPQPSTNYAHKLIQKIWDVERFWIRRSNPRVERVRAVEDKLTELQGQAPHIERLLHLHPKFSCLTIETWLLLVMAQCELRVTGTENLLVLAMDAYLSGEPRES